MRIAVEFYSNDLHILNGNSNDDFFWNFWNINGTDMEFLLYGFDDGHWHYFLSWNSKISKFVYLFNDMVIGKAFNFFSARKNDYLILLLSPQKLWIIYLKCFWQYRHWYFFFKLKSFSFMWVSLCFFRFLLPFNSNEQISHLIFRLSPNSCCSRRCTNKLAFLLKT